MFAIMGASGQTGKATIDALLAEGAPVRAITRQPERLQSLKSPGVEIVQADARTPASLAEAFRGAEAVYVLNAPSVASADVIGEARTLSAGIADAVRQANVRRVVALSATGANLPQGTGVIRTLHGFEEALRSTEASLIFIRATYFMESWGSAIEAVRLAGILPSFRQPLDDQMEMVSTSDVGRMAADSLLGREVDDTIVDLYGPRAYSALDVAESFARLVGRPVEAVAPPRESWLPSLQKAGLGPSYAGEVANMYDALNAGRITFRPGSSLRRGSTDLDAALGGLLGAQAAG
jgi:uncharacterized protein YbjT (DUF2867 family)